MAKEKKTKKKKVVKGEAAAEEAVNAPDATEEATTPQETADSSDVMATLLTATNYIVGKHKFVRGVPQRVTDPALAEKLRANSAFSVVNA